MGHGLRLDGDVPQRLTDRAHPWLARRIVVLLVLEQRYFVAAVERPG